MSTFEKPQSPIYSKSNDAYIYPLTTVDQVIMEDGSRLNNSIMTMELLWENADATSNFAAQIIQMDLSEYDGYLVEFAYSTSSSVKFTRPALGFCTISAQLISGVNSQDAMSVRGRECTLSENEVIFKDCYSHNMSATDNVVANQYMIPTRIYGIKGVSI